MRFEAFVMRFFIADGHKQAPFESLTTRVVEFHYVIWEIIEMKQSTTRAPRENRRDLFAD